jgi:hypothetical protein
MGIGMVCKEIGFKPHKQKGTNQNLVCYNGCYLSIDLGILCYHKPLLQSTNL